jgi:hypothetical protein
MAVGKKYQPMESMCDASAKKKHGRENEETHHQEEISTNE